MASYWMENPTDKDGLLLKHQLCEDDNVGLTHVISCVAGGALPPIRMKQPAAHPEHLSSWRYD